MILATVGQAVELPLFAVDGNTGLYGQAKVYLGAVLQATVALNHVAAGVYTGSWTPSAEGRYNVVAKLYTDAGRTTLADSYPAGSETIDASTLRTDTKRILGLLHANAVVDQTAYDTDGNLTSARVRCYDSAANATAGTNTGLLYSYTVAATYSGGLMTSYGIRQVT